MTTEEKPGWKSLPIAAVVPEPGSSLKYKTGDWRAFRPIVEKEKCVNCLICWIYCPEACVELNAGNKPAINYDYCKGCGICANECPLKIIRMEREGNAI